MLKDLVYFDFDKTASIWGQIESGLTERFSSNDAMRGERNKRIRHGLERSQGSDGYAVDAQERGILESKLLHHDLLNTVEGDLAELGLVADLNALLPDNESDARAIRGALGGNPYLRAEGWAAVEDYQRIFSIADHFNEIIDFIGKAEIQSVRNTEGYQELQRALDEARIAINAQADRNQKAIAKTKLQNAERQIAEMLKPGISPIETWLLEGIQKWIATFMPNRINFRVYPFDECPIFQVICNLKRDCFIDEDLEHLIYGYSNRPNIRFTVLGLVTSLPPEGPHPFDPMQEFEALSDTTDRIIFEKLFRSLFNVMGEIESFVKFSRWPNVTVHPLAIFRQLRSSQ